MTHSFAGNRVTQHTGTAYPIFQFRRRSTRLRRTTCLPPDATSWASSKATLCRTCSSLS